MSRFLALFAQWILRIFGWKTVGELPKVPKFIVIVAPHTSNWDFPLGVLLGFAWQAMSRTQWFGKHSIFWGPIGTLFRAMGGIPIDRSRPQAIVGTTLAALQQRSNFILALAPEGTRSYMNHWKSGFYLIAKHAQIPIALGFINYRDRELGIGPLLYLTGQEEDDWQKIRDFYQREWALYPALMSEIQPKKRNQAPR